MPKPTRDDVRAAVRAASAGDSLVLSIDVADQLADAVMPLVDQSYEAGVADGRDLEADAGRSREGLRRRPTWRSRRGA